MRGTRRARTAAALTIAWLVLSCGDPLVVATLPRPAITLGGADAGSRSGALPTYEVSVSIDFAVPRLDALCERAPVAICAGCMSGCCITGARPTGVCSTETQCVAQCGGDCAQLGRRLGAAAAQRCAAQCMYLREEPACLR